VNVRLLGDMSAADALASMRAGEARGKAFIAETDAQVAQGDGGSMWGAFWGNIANTFLKKETVMVPIKQKNKTMEIVVLGGLAAAGLYIALKT
jgi:hypothetical protein